MYTLLIYNDIFNSRVCSKVLKMNTDYNVSLFIFLI